MFYIARYFMYTYEVTYTRIYISYRCRCMTDETMTEAKTDQIKNTQYT